MATARQQPRAATAIVPAPGEISEPATVQFRVFEDSVGGYHWEVVAGSEDILVQSGRFATYADAEEAAMGEDFSSSGELLVQSGRFACYDDAEDAAHYVHDKLGFPVIG